jgi:predicted DNA-binding protein (UPF0278 family)
MIAPPYLAQRDVAAAHGFRHVAAGEILAVVASGSDVQVLETEELDAVVFSDCVGLLRWRHRLGCFICG